jgi:hypothetical protein
MTANGKTVGMKRADNNERTRLERRKNKVSTKNVL